MTLDDVVRMFVERRPQDTSWRVEAETRVALATALLMISMEAIRAADRLCAVGVGMRVTLGDDLVHVRAAVGDRAVTIGRSEHDFAHVALRRYGFSWVELLDEERVLEVAIPRNVSLAEARAWAEALVLEQLSLFARAA